MKELEFISDYFFSELIDNLAVSTSYLIQKMYSLINISITFKKKYSYKYLYMSKRTINQFFLGAVDVYFSV